MVDAVKAVFAIFLIGALVVFFEYARGGEFERELKYCATVQYCTVLQQPRGQEFSEVLNDKALSAFL
jgi:hypothetical protein